MVTATAIKKGYKQTELGVIPEDWVVKKLGALGSFSKGQGIRKDQSQSGELSCVRYGELYTRHNDYVKQYYSFISRDVAATSKRLAYGDILFAGSGETKEEIGKCAAFIDKIDAYAGGDIVVFSPLDTDSLFLGYLLNSPLVVRQKANKGQGDAVVHISASSLKEVNVPIPQQKEEQTAIAAVLSDTDALIEHLEKLIAKKKAIKHGAMQQLLTGQTRLPGFHGEWAVRRLGDLLSICHGKSQADVEVSDGSYPILGTGGQIGTASSALYDKPSVLIGRKGTINRPQYMDNPFWTVDTLFYSVIKDNNNAKFLYYRFCLIDWMQYNEASGVPSMSARTIENINIRCPKPNEQSAIAVVLSDIDTELVALETNRDKIRAIKQGMMQQLLTGKIRIYANK